MKEGDLLIHAHITIADEEGLAFGGHLLEGCKIYPFAEVMIQEINTVIHRQFDPKTNLWPINLD
jgi:predicted DNA-binding protein with PD1-like motif